MVLELSSGVYLHTAYAVSNIPNLFTEDDWSLDSQEGMRYVGTYTDDSPIDSTDPNDYIWAELLDTDVNDTDEEDVLPVADLQAQADALQDQIDILQSDASDLAVSIDNANQNLSSSTELANNAQQIAGNTNQYFWHTESGTDTGAHITEIPQEEFLEDPENGGGNLLARSNGIAVRDGLEELSTFGADGVVIGKTDESHLELTSTNIAMHPKNAAIGVKSFEVGDLNGSTITDSFEGDGIHLYFFLSGKAIIEFSQNITVTVDGVTQTYGTDYTVSIGGGGIEFVNAPSDGAAIEATYLNSEWLPYLHFGKPNQNATIGDFSVALGHQTESSGSFSFSSGYENQASGDYSNAQNRNTIADGDCQTAIGKYNEEDHTSAFIIGNGNSSNRSNALTVDWDGKEWLNDTLEVSRDPVSAMEVATKQYVDNSGGGGTSDYTQLSNKPQVNGVTLTGNKTTSQLGISIPTKTSDLTNDSGYIPKDDLFFKPGDVYTVTYNHARALTGYISSSTTGMYFEIPLPKFLTDVTSANITAMTGGVRGIGGYVNGLSNGSNLKSGFTVTASVDNPNTLYVSVVKGSALTNATNNTPISVALNSISITFS